jgi:hypothetical protein
MNLYSYAANRPTNAVDAMGLWPSWSEVGTGLAIVGAGIAIGAVVGTVGGFLAGVATAAIATGTIGGALLGGAILTGGVAAAGVGAAMTAQRLTNLRNQPLTWQEGLLMASTAYGGSLANSIASGIAGRFGVNIASAFEAGQFAVHSQCATRASASDIAAVQAWIPVKRNSSLKSWEGNYNYRDQTMEISSKSPLKVVLDHEEGHAFDDLLFASRGNVMPSLQLEKTLNGYVGRLSPRSPSDVWMNDWGLRSHQRYWAARVAR